MLMLMFLLMQRLIGSYAAYAYVFAYAKIDRFLCLCLRLCFSLQRLIGSYAYAYAYVFAYAKIESKDCLCFAKTDRFLCLIKQK